MFFIIMMNLWYVCVERLRNVNSKLLECMRSVVAKGQNAYGYQHRILMTGTPLQVTVNTLMYMEALCSF